MNTRILNDDQLYPPKEAAIFLGCSINFLAKDRMKEKPLIPYTKLSPKFVRYRGAILRRVISSDKAA